jgi:hypothetical protein
MTEDRDDDAVAATDTNTGIASDVADRDQVVEVPQASATDRAVFGDEQAESYRARWTRIQARFVDDPRQAVQDADELVSAVIDELETTFRTRRESLEASLQRGDDASTEDLRLTLQGYRSFFGRLLDA